VGHVTLVPVVRVLRASVLYAPPAPVTLGACPPLPTGDAACELIQGQSHGLWTTLGWTLLRAGLIGAGMMVLAGERDPKKLAVQSLAGSAAIESFVIAWAAATKKPDGSCAPLPSGSCAEDLLGGRPEGFLTTLGTMAGRGAIAAVGIGLAGERDPWTLAKKSIAGVAAIESFILLWMAANQTEKK
jgi:hypothetical protein